MVGRGRKHALWVALLWITLTVAGEAVVLTFDVLPPVAAEEGRVVDAAFRLLTILGMPVFTFVVAVLVYSVLVFRSRGTPEQDGPPLVARPLIAGAWLVATSALSIYVIINPGLTGLAELRTHREPDVVVQVEGSRWQWKVTYPRQQVTSNKELVLPVNKHVRFDVTAVDVVHSFWIPSFRMKIDAVPGRVTTVHVTPTQTGTEAQDFNLRLVCAELCGLGHSLMSLSVRVVEQADFDRWVSSARTATAADGERQQALAGSRS
ncbi:MAG: cytochrome c oxidase subunit II [Chloroflexi bacterium]|nr:cytochrome c oxidase subunit II [Chloroflexota bacterium]